MAEHPSCFSNLLSINGTAANQIRFQMRDQDNSSAVYSGRVYADSPNFNSATDFVTVTTSAGTATYNITNATFGTGTKNLQDGAQHIFYFLMVTNTQGDLTSCSGQAQPYKYNTGAAGPDFTYGVATVDQSTGATPQNMSIQVIPGVAYSTGSAGGGATKMCTVNGTDVYDNGIAGYYISKYGIPCGHVHTFPIATTNTVTITAAQTAYAAMSPALGSDEQFNALAWAFPYGITGITSAGTAGTLTNDTMSMAAFFYNNGVAMTSRTITTNVAGTPTVVAGDSVTQSPYFQSSTTTPFTTYGKRPTFQLAWGKCDGSGFLCAGNTFSGPWAADFTTARDAVGASYAARGSAPVNGVMYTQSNSLDFGRSAQYSLTPPLAYGLNTGVAPASAHATVTAIVSTSNLINAPNILSYELANSNPSTSSSPSFIAPGIGYLVARTSFSGQLNGTAQAPIFLYLLYGAAFSCGSDNEPYGLLATKYPEDMLMMSLYTRGATAIESAWKATKQPYNMVCSGDPLAQFKITPGPTVTPNYILLGKLK